MLRHLGGSDAPPTSCRHHHTCRDCYHAQPGPQAIAEAPKCKNKANKYVACTDKLKANTTPRKKSARRLPVLMVIPNRDWGGSSASKRRLAK